MAIAERDVLINLRCSREEREKLAAIADANDEPYSMTIRRFIKQQYEARFGDVAPTKLARKGA